MDLLYTANFMKSYIGIVTYVDVCFSLDLQTGKINQGNIALKRVVESIANGDSHVPFRDSKLTMLLQVKLRSCHSQLMIKNGCSNFYLGVFCSSCTGLF